MKNKTEVWQRGPLENMPVLLQPVAHALLQAREELYDMMNKFPQDILWEKPAGVASPAFHLQHLTGVLDRLFTYARKQPLTSEQLHALSIEGNQQETKHSMVELIDLFHKQVDLSIQELSAVNTDMLTEVRTVGRKNIPSTVIGLYVHAAEHAMRHIGQLWVTVQILKDKESKVF
ncbi:MAG: DinB family protein [Ginsengibacter sp.]